MHPILDEFLDKWVWPTAPGAPGAAFRRRITEEKCIKGWELALDRSLNSLREGQASGDDKWRRASSMGGYCGEGVQASIKQMSALMLAISLEDQEKYIDIQRARARQVWDECKHSKLHAEVMVAKGWVKSERELATNPIAYSQRLPSFFGLMLMSPHGHPLARAASHYYQEGTACIGIMAHLALDDDPIVKHEYLSQRDEELMHFMEGKYTIDTFGGEADNQKAIEDQLDYLLHRIRLTL